MEIQKVNKMVEEELSKVKSITEFVKIFSEN